MLKTLSVLLAATFLSGCAAMNRLSSEVSSYGSWPAGRKASSFAFERLPSQQERPEQIQRLEDAARPALEAAGFKQVADGTSAEYTVQLGAVISADARSLHDGFGSFGPRGYLLYPRFGYGHWLGHGFGYGRFGSGLYATPVYDREVLVLIRDRTTGQTIYETRASNSGWSSAVGSLLPAMFEAALKDFPSSGVNPRRVVTQIGS